MDWKKELLNILNNGCSDSDIEDFIIEHPTISGKDVWDFVYDTDAPEQCKGCVHIQNRGFMPCIRCSKIIQTRDYYEPR